MSEPRVIPHTVAVRSLFRVDATVAAGTSGTEREDDTFWLPGALAVKHVNAVLDCYLRDPRLRCLHVRRRVLGRARRCPWNEGGIDEFCMSETWPRALADVLEGGERAVSGGSAWEESTLVLDRHGARLWISDDAAGMWPAVDVDLFAFSRTMLREAVVFRDVMRALSSEMARRGFPNDALLDRLRRDRPEAAPVDLATKMAVIRENLVLLDDERDSVARLKAAVGDH